jgi:hypothetical protein
VANDEGGFEATRKLKESKKPEDLLENKRESV